MKHKIRSLLLGGAALLALSAVALADSGFFNNWPILGGNSYCATFVNGICQTTVPAGPAASGNETVPGDTHLSGGQSPQQVNIPVAALGITVMNQQTPLTGFTITMAAGQTNLNLTPAGTLATGTVALPPNPVNGQKVVLFSSQTITALTLNAGATPTGTTIVGGVTTLAANAPVAYVYQLSNNTWYRT